MEKEDKSKFLCGEIKIHGVDPWFLNRSWVSVYSVEIFLHLSVRLIDLLP